MTIDSVRLAQLRRDTPGTGACLHFDNAGASPSPLSVHRRVVRHLERELAIGGYAAMGEVEDELAGLYESIAALIGAHSDEIAFVENATRAWDMAFYGIGFRPGDQILTSRAEYVSNYLAFLHMANRYGVEIEAVPDGEDGTIDVAALQARLGPRTKVVNVCHVPTSNGLINDIEAVGKVLKDHPAIYMVDACQSVGQIDIDVGKIGCHVLSATGRKYLRGPRGTGFLYVRRDAFDRIQPPFVDMRAANWVSTDRFEWRGDAKRYETWESAIATRLGLKQAVDYARNIGIPAIERRTQELGALLRQRLAECANVTVRDRGRRRSGIVTFVVNGRDPFKLRDWLRGHGVAVSAIGLEDARLDLDPEGHAAILRASAHCFNTHEEVTRFVDALIAGIGETA